MKVTEQDIIRAARQLRDEENEQLHVQPWTQPSPAKPRRRQRALFAIPAAMKYAAVPAAAILGFVFGFWTKSNSQLDTPLAALVDTIYIKVHEPQPHQDTIAQALPAIQGARATPPAKRGQRTTPPAKQGPWATPPANIVPQPALGRPVADDHIRYDLLVRN